MFAELSKLDKVLQKPVERMTSLEMWSIFLQYADKPEQREIVERVTEAKRENGHAEGREENQRSVILNMR
jgi:hypothetical protein